MRTSFPFCVYKNTKKQKSNESLPSHFSASPYYFTSLSIPPMSQTGFYYVPFYHLGYPISPFGISHFTIWGIPFYHLECPISPFGVSHFAIWGIPFHHLGCPILPFGVYFRHICAQRTAPMPDLASSFFRCNSLCVFFPFGSSCFFGIRLAG